MKKMPYRLALDWESPSFPNDSALCQADIRLASRGAGNPLNVGRTILGRNKKVGEVDSEMAWWVRVCLFLLQKT